MPALVESPNDSSAPPSPTQSFVCPTQRVTSHTELPPSPVDSHGSIFDEDSATVKEETRLTREITRGTPGDRRRPLDMKCPHQRDLARKRSQYYENAFAVDPKPAFSARDRVLRESIIMADIKTNVIIYDEYAFITDVSYALSIRYQRPEKFIIVTVSHSSCVLFGGNFDPAYLLNITALPSQVLPITNRRNAALLAKSMEEALGISAERGIIKFTSIPEENLAHDGRTVAREIEELENAQEENRTTGRNLSSRSTTRSRRRPSIKSLRGYKTSHQLPTHDEVITSTSPHLTSTSRNCTPIPERPHGVIIMEHQPDQVQKMGRHRSFIASIFGRA
ncbi:putative mif domain-containing protein [Golovinomyces cichoracearum]|uniref:L-dopachrome isomerase n=1 Tax=Golovinomyces cichoracearum TaxID=62708 RepID=A0A420ITK8_9PEZI|nr:putative mif domain-containing protein [Golovinomyces cichoracearum]